MRKRNHNENERGAVSLIEAAFVLPVTFIVVFLMLMAGEAFYQHARAEYQVIHAVVQGAADCENPMLIYVEKHGNTVPTGTKDVKVLPYRHIYDKEASKIVDELESKLERTISSQKPLFFQGMTPKNVNATKSVHAGLGFILSSIGYDCSFDIEFPITMIFSSEKFKIHFTIYEKQMIGDPAELIRNVSIVTDTLERSKAATEFFKEIADKIDTFMKYAG